jgi:hypothetical protein
VAHDGLRYDRAAQRLGHHVLRGVPLLQVGHLRAACTACRASDL